MDADEVRSKTKETYIMLMALKKFLGSVLHKDEFGEPNEQFKCDFFCRNSKNVFVGIRLHLTNNIWTDQDFLHSKDHVRARSYTTH